MGNFRIWIMLGVALLATIFWDARVLLPLKLLTVFIHEAWHGLAGLAFGGHLQKISLSLQESGSTHMSGLSSRLGFVVAVSAGYLGSTLTGVVLLNRGLRAGFERSTLILFSVILLYMSLLFADPGGTAFLTGMLWALAMLVPVVIGPRVARVVLIGVGTLLVWYSLYDMLDFTRDPASTDAGILWRYLKGSETPQAASVWSPGTISFAWCTAMAGIVLLGLRGAVRGEAQGHGPPVPPPQPEDLPPTPEQFPGELTPDVQEWFLMNGMGPDGQPLPPELLELQSGGDPAHGPEQGARGNA